jgi:uncharacterized protein (TIGR00251 family)
MSWLHGDGTAVVLTLHIQPGARKTEICGLHGDALKIRLAAPPVDGKANDCLIAFLAERLSLARNAIDLISGASARSKRVRIHGVSIETVTQRLQVLP